MKKIALSTALLVTTSIAIFSLFAQEVVVKKPIYLHKQKKRVRSENEHLNQFISEGNVIVDFYADWCPPCNRMSPLIDAAATNMPEFTFIKINRDFFGDLAKQLNVTSIPTLIFFRNGKEIGRYTAGPLTQNKLEQLILKTYNSPS